MTLEENLDTKETNILVLKKYMSSTNIMEQVHKNHSYTRVVYSQPSIQYRKIIHVIHHGWQNLTLKCLQVSSCYLGNYMKKNHKHDQCPARVGKSDSSSHHLTWQNKQRAFICDLCAICTADPIN